ncbi:DUF4236 domain-containing protein [Clostridium sp.]|uniref:DUF4236 domain-containing protein n=1 Tax=Clostridium sp. TaxID=1506 RepID=UPI00261A81F7|nr:DUF4236 domain-containing protein [Clostridium sp.]
MGFRFRKSKNFGPFRINLSKSGIGWSVGTKGARYTKRADGKKQTTLSIPGTGLSYVDVSGNKRKSKNNKNANIPNSDNFSSNNNFFNNDNNNKPKTPFYKKSLFIWLMLFFLPPVGIILMWTSNKYNKKPRIALSAIFAFYALLMYTSNANNTNTALANNKPQIQQSNTNKEKVAAEEAEKQRIAQEKVAAEEAEKQKIVQEKAAAEEAEKQRIAQEKAAAEEAEKQKIAQEVEEQRINEEQVAVQQVQSNTSGGWSAPVVVEPTSPVQESIGQTVHISSSGNGKKYHSDPNCSSMNGTIHLSVDEALNRGYTACKKCY